MSTPAAKRMTVAALVELLGADRARRYPDLYRGAEHTAREFWRLTGGTRHYLLLAAINAGLVPRDTK